MFEFKLDEEVGIANTELEGTIIGRAEYANGTPNNYWVRYIDAKGDLCKVWFDEADLEAFEE